MEIYISENHDPSKQNPFGPAVEDIVGDHIHAECRPDGGDSSHDFLYVTRCFASYSEMFSAVYNFSKLIDQKVTAVFEHRYNKAGQFFEDVHLDDWVKCSYYLGDRYAGKKS